ncbi:MAG: hypothetical protein ABSG76_01180 [Xanthobacteraceae bacterium]
MPPKEDPFRRLQRLLKDSSRYQNVDQSVDRAFRRSLRTTQIKEQTSRLGIRRTLGGSGAGGKAFSVKGDPQEIARTLGSARGGRVTSKWAYRRALGHLTEDAAARDDHGRRFAFTDARKDTNARGIDMGHLGVDRNGRFVVVPSDVKALQAVRNISSVTALRKNLAKNLQNERAAALAAARDKTRPYGERVLFRAASMTMNRILNKNPKSPAKSIRAAMKDGRLRLEVRNDGGNATGLSKKLEKFGMHFVDRRLYDKGSPVVNKFRHGLLNPKVLKRYGLPGTTTVQRHLSRSAALSAQSGSARQRNRPRLINVTSGQAALENFRARLAASRASRQAAATNPPGPQPPPKPARPVGVRTGQPGAPPQKAAKPVGSRSTTGTTPSQTSAPAKPIGPRSARPTGGTGASTKGGHKGAVAPTTGGTKTAIAPPPAPAPVPPPTFGPSRG